MRVYTMVEIDIETGEVSRGTSVDWQGPVALCGDAGLIGDLPGATVAEPAEPAEPAGDGEPSEPSTGDEPFQPELEPEPEPEGEEAQAEGEPTPEPVKAAAEPLPAALSKAIRELKQAHPEHAPVLKTLNDAYYANRAYKQLGSVDELRTTKAAMESAGGPDGIASMRSDISSIQQFDRMAAEGDPKVISGLADEFPEGFKRLVPAAVERLSKSDPAAYRETMRGPLLQMLEGDGLIDVIGSALDELKQGAADLSATSAPNLVAYMKRAERELGRIAGWYNGLKKEETEFKGRYVDPRISELDQREKAAAQRELEIHQKQYTRDVSTYVGDTVRRSVLPMTKGMKITQDGINDLVLGVRQEMNNALRANQFYMTSVTDLVNQGKTEEALNFAKPYIDQARKNAVNAVWARRYGTAPSAARTAPPPRRVAPANGSQSPAAASDKPIPVAHKPNHDDIDWSRDPKNLLFVTGSAYLKSGKYVTWRQPPAR